MLFKLQTRQQNQNVLPLTDGHDTFGTFSNTGSAVNIAAPGVNILSTYNGTEYALESGTVPGLQKGVIQQVYQHP